MNSINTGIGTLNGSADKLDKKTVIVLGLARGGTSMVAGTLNKLGVYMGKRLSAIFEDQEFAQCIKDNDSRKVKSLIHERNSDHDVWGVKHMSLKRAWHKYFRQPVYIVVFRDLFAVAKRRQIAASSTLFPELFSALKHYAYLLIFLRFTKRPVLLISYEKALNHPAEFVKQVCDFLGITTDRDLDEVASFIVPSPSGYTDKIWLFGKEAGQQDQWYGNIDLINPDRVAGWIQNADDPEPLSIELIINETVVASGIANLEREDVQKRYPNLRNECGFSIALPESITIQPDDHITIRSLKYGKRLDGYPG